MIPGSALRRLAAITGLPATKEADACYRLEIAPEVALFSFLGDEGAACRSLREQNWRRVVRNACEAAGWKCSRCGGIKALQGHHRIYRSRWRPEMGPLDVAENTIAVCNSCHHQIHVCHNDIHEQGMDK